MGTREIFTVLYSGPLHGYCFSVSPTGHWEASALSRQSSITASFVICNYPGLTSTVGPLIVQAR
jgi:hypothetical protein